MQKKSWPQRLLRQWPLLAMYVGFVLLRFLLALATTCFPTVYIDEFLYYSLGRSIATEGQLLYHGQPALYNYIVYPLVLSPVYRLLGPGGNYYRLIQLWNILWMTASVFPVYGLCRAMMSDRKKALWLTALFMLLPDYILGEFVFSEAVIYPLFYTLIYCVYRHLKTPRASFAAWVGILGALLYYTKPGAVVPAAAALMLFAGKAIKARSGKEGLYTLYGALGLGVCFLLLKLLAEQALSYQGAFFSIYDAQLNDYRGLSYDIFFRSAALYPYYFLLACGVLPCVAALWRLRRLDTADRQFFLMVACCVAVMAVGTAWTVNRPERSQILYLRYMDMYLPLIFACSILPERREAAGSASVLRRVSPGRWIAVLLLGYAAACTAIWGSTAGIGGQFDTHFLFSAAVFFTRNIAGIANILIILACCASLYLLIRYDGTKKLRLFCCGVFVLCLLANNTAGYLVTATNTDADRGEESLALQRSLNGEEYLYLYANNICDYGLDVNTGRNISQVALYDFYNHVRENGGVYVPFVPESEKGMTAQHPTPDVDLLLLDENAHPLVIFSDAVTQADSSLGHFRVARLEKGQRAVDSMIANVESLTLKKEAVGILAIFNPDWIGRPIAVNLELESPVDQEMEMFGEQHFSFPLTAGRYHYNLKISNPEALYNLIVHEDNVRLCGYTISVMEASE